jgi:hypothetical protein
MSSNENDNPQAPSAPLQGSPDNPFASSSPSADLSGDTNRGFGNPVYGYYTNPAVSPLGNPSAGGALGQAQDANEYMNGNLSDLANANLANMRGGTDSMPTDTDFSFDEAFGKTGTGNS